MFPFGFRAKKDRGTGFFGFGRAKNGTRAKVGGFQKPGICLLAFLSFFPPLRLLAPLFRAVFDSRSSFVCSETARKRFLRRLDHNSKAKESSINPIQTWGRGVGRLLRFSIPHGFKVKLLQYFKTIQAITAKLGDFS